MTKIGEFDDIEVTLDGNVALIEIQRPPHNFFDHALISQLADACETLGDTVECRAIVLAAQGKSFCAGANFGDGSGDKILENKAAQPQKPETHLYVEAVRLFATPKPIVGATTLSSATMSRDARTRSTRRGTPVLGPSPSIATVASQTAKAGFSTLWMSASTSVSTRW